MPRDWDQYYSDPDNLDLTPDAMLVELADVLKPGDALDLACGAGRHALYLAQLGWRVTAVDAAEGALHVIKERGRGLHIQAHRADLEQGEFLIAPQKYDLICDFFYLQRDLFPQIREGIRPGGLFVGALRLTGTYSVKPGELRAEFAGWKILFYSETEAARIIAKR